MKGERVILRKVRDGDVADRQFLGRHPEVLRGFGIIAESFKPMTIEEAETWVKKLSTHPSAWVIEHDGKFIGEVRLDGIDEHDKRASLAIGIYDPKLLGIGLGSEAIRLCLNYAFDVINLHRISARVLASNERAIRCYQKCGFVEEGREREAALINGNWQDDLIMGVLNKNNGAPLSP